VIVVFGSINIDLVTKVARIPAPGETVLGPSYAVIPGGKGANQALAARRAGANVALAGTTGRDGFADLALALLRSEDVDLSAVANSGVPTGAAFIAVDVRGENAIVVAAGANGETRADQIRKFDWKDGDFLLLQRETPDAEGEAAAHYARSLGASVILNLAPAGPISRRYLEAVDILIMNEQEAMVMGKTLDLIGSDGKDPLAVARAIDCDFNTAAIVTLGAEGACGWNAGQSCAVPAPRITAVDTTAAGDAFVGAFAAALDQGEPFRQALICGVAAGTLACTRNGAQPSLPRASEIRALAAKIGGAESVSWPPVKRQ
jgi:ribokinase